MEIFLLTVVPSHFIHLIEDHVLHGRLIFPGTGCLEPATLLSVYFLQPLAVEAPGLLIECVVSDGRFEVRSSEADAIEASTVHCSGATAGGNASQRIDPASQRAPSLAADVGALYDGFDVVGLQYGPGYRTLVRAWGGASDALARLRARSTHEGTQVHPADLDDALCTSRQGNTSRGTPRCAESVGSATRRPSQVGGLPGGSARHAHEHARASRDVVPVDLTHLPPRIFR